MTKLSSLKSATSLSDLAKLLRFKPSALSYILYKQPPTAKYLTFEIPKRKGGTRAISAPSDALKLLQRNLSGLLQDCVEEINAAKNRKDRIAHGFKRKRSIITNGRQHRSRRYVFNADLEDFFPSINFGRVRGFFIKDRSFLLDKDVATVIAKLACYENALPQGSPCSPVISNLIAHVLDIHLVLLASSVGCTYSRYADDLTFSTNKKVFPDQIAKPSYGPHVWVPGNELQRLVTRSGFRINPAKVHMQYRASRQEVTGLVVNRRVNVRREYRHTVRAMVHSLLSKGTFDVYAAAGDSGKLTLEKRPGTLNQLHGMLGFIDKIDLEHREHTAESQESADLSSSELMYQRFLIYETFYAAKIPTIVCEGETDNVYLTHAIRSLCADFPELAEITGDRKIRLRVRLYKYRSSSTARVTGLRNGGTGCLSTFISTYKRETEKFGAPGGENPVIILYDNDSGANNIRSAIKAASGKILKHTEPFVHVVRNLYAVPTPLQDRAKDSKIEDFFDVTLKATKVNGKTFNDKNNFDPAMHYGKKVFAHRVVRANEASINFDGFRPLLTNLVSVINAHAKAHSGATSEVVATP